VVRGRRDPAVVADEPAREGEARVHGDGEPAAGEQGEPASAQAAQRTLDSVAGAGVDIELLAAGGLFDWNQDADACALVAGVGQGGQACCRRLLESGKGVGAGGGDVVHRPGFHIGDPQRESIGGEDGLNVAAVGVRLARIPQVDDLALDADGRLFAPVAGDDRAIQDHMREPVVPGAFQRLAQRQGRSASTVMNSSTYR